MTTNKRAIEPLHDRSLNKSTASTQAEKQALGIVAANLRFRSHRIPGRACPQFGHIYPQPRGTYLSMTRRGRVKEILGNWHQKDLRFICVADGGRILGLGDLGAIGAGTPLALREVQS